MNSSSEHSFSLNTASTQKRRPIEHDFNPNTKLRVAFKMKCFTHENLKSYRTLTLRRNRCLWVPLTSSNNESERFSAKPVHRNFRKRLSFSNQPTLSTRRSCNLSGSFNSRPSSPSSAAIHSIFPGIVCADSCHYVVSVFARFDARSSAACERRTARALSKVTRNQIKLSLRCRLSSLVRDINSLIAITNA